MEKYIQLVEVIIPILIYNIKKFYFEDGEY